MKFFTEEKLRQKLGGPKWFQDKFINCLLEGVSGYKKLKPAATENELDMVNDYLAYNLLMDNCRPAINPIYEGTKEAFNRI